MYVFSTDASDMVYGSLGGHQQKTKRYIEGVMRCDDISNFHLNVCIDYLRKVVAKYYSTTSTVLNNAFGHHNICS